MAQEIKKEKDFTSFDHLYLGDVLDAMFYREGSALGKMIVAAIWKGKTIAVFQENEVSVVFFRYRHKEFSLLKFFTKKSHLNPIELLARVDMRPKRNEFSYITPVFSGLPQNVCIKEKIASEDDELEYLRFELTDFDFGASFIAFDPLFRVNQQEYLEKNGKTKLYFSALALSIEKNSHILIRVNPSLDEKVQTNLYSDQLLALLPSDCIDGYQYNANVLAVEKFSFMREKFFRLKIELLMDQRHNIWETYLYVSEKTAAGYIPETGDSIGGFMRLSCSDF